jgi:outer membrane protein OmpA-like peptidoglycan-associated protein
MDIRVRVRKGVGSAFARGMLVFVTLGIGVDTTSGQGLVGRPHEVAACHIELRTLYDHDQLSRYFVEQIFLGGRIVSNASAYQRYRCSPSEQFENFIWCTKTCSGSDTLQRGNFQATYSLLHAKDGSVAYVNRFQKPAYWAMNEINEDIQKLSQKFGSQPKILRLPTRDGLARAVLATWGKVRLEPLESEALKLLGEGKKFQSGLLVDFIGDFSRSAREGLPIYRIAGEAGFIWVASHDQDGRGILRFSAADPSTYSAPSAPVPPSPPPKENPATLGGVAANDRQADGTVTAAALLKAQEARDSLFRNLNANTSGYSFDYVVITLPPGTLPGLNMPVTVSHIRYSSTVFFAFDKYFLEPGADAVITDFAKTILADKTVRSIVVVGHTDSIGADQYNETLSLKRATTVAKALQTKGVSENVLGMVPMGEAQPVASNSTEQGRAQNRRVEFFISDIPAATPKAIERIKFNPCHRNDHEPAARPEDCGGGPMRIPVHYVSGLQTTLDLTRGALPVESMVRAPLPSEILQRPSIRELQQP